MKALTGSSPDSVGGGPVAGSAGNGDRSRLDEELCYRAVQSRDRRFDGWFYTAVRTTGIYCRPSCPAITPKRHNVEFYTTAATAQQRGFRACKRCRPDVSPGSPEWDRRGDVVARAMRLIADGAVDRYGVAGLAKRLSYSERQLNRLMTAELGVGPLAIAREHRARTARTLIETTDLSFTDIAFASGFGSVRQFNDTVRTAYATAPTDLRRRRATTPTSRLQVTLAARPPFAGGQLVSFLSVRAVPGIEHVDAGVYSRTLSLPHGRGVAVVRVADDGAAVAVELTLTDVRDLTPAVQRLRRLFDLDADPVAIDAALGADDVIGPLVEREPGLRVAGSVDPFETAVRAIIGQQVSIGGARTVAGRLVAALGVPLGIEHDDLAFAFPAPADIIEAPDEAFPMPASRRDTIRRLAGSVLDGDVQLDPAADRGELRGELLAIRGIGPWTADYILMRACADPDAFLPTDLGVIRAIEATGADDAAVDRWRPWRSYALHHLWNHH